MYLTFINLLCCCCCCCCCFFVMLSILETVHHGLVAGCWVEMGT